MGADAVTNFPLSDYYPELTDLGKQGLPGQGIPIDAGDDENYTYEEYDDDNEDDNSAQPSTSHPMYSGLAHQGISWPQGSSKPQGSPPLPPTQHGIFSRPPAATSLSSGANPTGSEPLPGSSIAASGRPKSLDELLRDLGRSELWGVKRVRGRFPSASDCSSGAVPSQATILHDVSGDATAGWKQLASPDHLGLGYVCVCC